jgi:hypothetical protein
MKSVGIIAALLLMALLASPASAVVLGLNWGTGLSPVTIQYHGSNHNVYVGSLKSYLGGQLGNPLPPNDGVYAGDVFCVDLDHFISIPTEYDVQIESASSLTSGGRLAWIYQQHWAEAKNDAGLAASMQLALWDVVTDGGDGLSSGNFRYISGLNAKTNSDAATMITQSQGQLSTATIFRATGPYGQTMIGVPVPEPGTFGLLGLGIGLVGFAFFRKRS